MAVRAPTSLSPSRSMHVVSAAELLSSSREWASSVEKCNFSLRNVLRGKWQWWATTDAQSGGPTLFKAVPLHETWGASCRFVHLEQPQVVHVLDGSHERVHRDFLCLAVLAPEQLHGRTLQQSARGPWAVEG